jgi:hypothetical protein
MVTFITTLVSGGGNTSGIDVPEDIWHELTSAGRAPVLATLGDYSYRSTVGWYRGAFKLPVSAAIRSATGLAVGDTVEVSLELDTEVRVIEAPADLAAALDAEAEAKAAWEALAPSGKKAHVTAVEGAKTDETRRRRVAKVIETLTGR